MSLARLAPKLRNSKQFGNPISSLIKLTEVSQLAGQAWFEYSLYIATSNADDEIIDQMPLFSVAKDPDDYILFKVPSGEVEKAITNGALFVKILNRIDKVMPLVIGISIAHLNDSYGFFIDSDTEDDSKEE